VKGEVEGVEERREVRREMREIKDMGKRAGWEKG
jgi:hypothetical protein